MPANTSTTVRNALRYLLNTSTINAIGEGFQKLAEDVDTKMASWWEDTLAKRPAAAQPNRLFRATDTHAIYHDTGAAWEKLLRDADGLELNAGVTFVNYAATTGFNHVPSATRPAMVTITALATGTAQLYKIEGNGNLIGHPLGYLWVEAAGADSCTFYLPPGYKYTLTRLSAGPDCTLEVQEFVI